MHRTAPVPARLALIGAATVALLAVAPASAQQVEGAKPASDAPAPAARRLPETTVEWARQQADVVGRRFVAWYRATPPSDRITWGGLAACGVLGVLTLLERMARVRRRRVIPAAFRDRFQSRIAEGKLDWAKGLDYCELNPSPAARVAVAALRRWGRPAPDLDRAVAIARQVESDRLRRNIGTLRRLAVLAPLIGLLGGLVIAGRSLSALPAGAAWGPVVAHALMPLTAGVGLAILALVAYDGLIGRAEKLAVELDRIGSEVVDAIAMATPTPAPAAPRAERTSQHRAEPAARDRGPHVHGHPVRVEVPRRFVRSLDGDLDD